MSVYKVKHIRYFATQSNKVFYVTTPIFYVNASPHIGHLYSAVIADAICRYQRLRRPEGGTDGIHLCTGTDEHGMKVQQAAIAHNVPVSRYCDDISARYRKVFQEALVHNTDFVRTTEQRHQNAVQHFWRTLRSRGHIYSAQYSGWYCVSDETFLTDSQLQKDPVSGQCFSLESGHPAEWTEETNYMFSLTKFQNDIQNWLKSQESSRGRVRPANFKKILEDYLSEPLPDISISRPASRVQWATPVPEDNTQTIYVWLDALINYLTSAGYPNEAYKRKWPPRIQVIGKDILKFHGIYWPAFLLAAGLEPPQELFVHSHWVVDGQKMSKSKHNVVDPQKAAETFTMEGLRYFLLREGVAHRDGNYSTIKALRILNSELADTLGNLLSRVCSKSLNPRQIYPLLRPVYLQKILQLDAAKRLEDSLQQLEERCSYNYDNNNFYLVVDTVMSTLHAANNFFESARPWELKAVTKSIPTSRFNETIVNNNNKLHTDNTQTSSSLENSYKLETILAMTMDTLRLCGIILQPLLPVLSSRLLDKLNVSQTERQWHNLNEYFANRSFQVPEKQLDNSINSVLFYRVIQKEVTNNEQQKYILK